MSGSGETGRESSSGFSTGTVLALVIVSVVSLSALVVLGAFAPSLRGGDQPAAHALSSSAVGFRGATLMLEDEGVPVSVLRAPSRADVANRMLMVLTPPSGVQPAALSKLDRAFRVLIILPKWDTAPDLARPGFVTKLGVGVAPGNVAAMLAPYAEQTDVRRRADVARPSLRGDDEGGPFAAATFLQLGPVDRLQTIGGDGWLPALVDDQGRMVLAQSRRRPEVLVLTDPDLLNTQGIANLDTARAGMAILDVLKGSAGVGFDVTLNGIKEQRSILALMLEPPWLAATLCAVAAALLMGAHAFARFGAPKAQGRAVAMGREALVETSAGLVRVAGKEHELAPAYGALTCSLIAHAVGTDEGANPDWLSDLARRRGAAAPEALAGEARRVRSRGDLLAVGRRLYQWRQEITRGRR